MVQADLSITKEAFKKLTHVYIISGCGNIHSFAYIWSRLSWKGLMMVLLTIELTWIYCNNNVLRVHGTWNNVMRACLGVLHWYMICINRVPYPWYMYPLSMFTYYKAKGKRLSNPDTINISYKQWRTRVPHVLHYLLCLLYMASWYCYIYCSTLEDLQWLKLGQPLQFSSCTPTILVI